MKEIQTIIRVKETQAITSQITEATELSLLMKSVRKWRRRAITTLTEIQTETLTTIRVQEAN